MPIYQYRCTKGHEFDVMQRMSDDALTKCEVCGAKAQRVLFAPAIHFKGSGFHNTDYGTKRRPVSEDGGSSGSSSTGPRRTGRAGTARPPRARTPARAARPGTRASRRAGASPWGSTRSEASPVDEPSTSIVHLRIVVPSDLSAAVLESVRAAPGSCNVAVLAGAAVEPPGDVLLADVAREGASSLVEGLRELGVVERGAISMDHVNGHLSAASALAAEETRGAPGDAVVWEEVEAATSEAVALTWSFGLFMVLAALIAGAGIFLDSPILIVGAMVVGPEFGPLAGVCVALVEGRSRLAGRSLTALAVGFPLAIPAAWIAPRSTAPPGSTPDTFSSADHGLADVISNPDAFSVIVAFCAGVAGMLSLTTAKSSVLIGVLISVTTIPAAANVGVAAAYDDWNAVRGSLAQLGLNLAVIVIAGTLTLGIQRAVYLRRRRARV